MTGRREVLEGDPFGIHVAQVALDAAIAERDLAIVATVQAGTTHKVTAELFGVTAPRVTQIVTAHRDRVWPVSVSTGRAGRLTHADAVTDMRVAIHAQQLRAEAATSGYASELRGFYGSDKVAPSDRPEQRLTLAAARREHTARLAHERELATRHAERQRKSA